MTCFIPLLLGFVAGRTCDRGRFGGFDGFGGFCGCGGFHRKCCRF